MSQSRVETRKKQGPPRVSSPSSGVSTPAIIFISVDFPAPLPPISACTRQKEREINALQHGDAGELFANLTGFRSSGFIIAPSYGINDFFNLIMFKSVDGELYLQPKRSQFHVLDRWKTCNNERSVLPDGSHFPTAQ